MKSPALEHNPCDRKSFFSKSLIKDQNFLKVISHFFQFKGSKLCQIMQITGITYVIMNFHELCTNVLLWKIALSNFITTYELFVKTKVI